MHAESRWRRRPASRTILAALLLPAALVAGPQAEPAPAKDAPQLLVVWSPRALPASARGSLERVSGVRAATPVRLGMDWLLHRGTGRVNGPPAGYGYPLESIAVSPGAYSKFAPRGDRAAIKKLGKNEILISRSEARLRNAARNSRLRLRSGGVRVAGVVSDRATQGYEVLRARPAPSAWRYSARFFLVRTDPGVSKKALRNAVERVTYEGIPLGIEKGARYLRYSSNVKPLTSFKRNFGEFPARPADSGSLQMLPKWVGRHIRSASVPILGNVTCHRKLFDQLRGALRELQRKGLAGLIRRDEYAGCYNARYVATPPGIRLSRHAWGIALDVNTSNNRFGETPHQDRRLIKIMRKWGFLWGGNWPLPDGMHFEWRRFP